MSYKKTLPTKSYGVGLFVTIDRFISSRDDQKPNDQNWRLLLVLVCYLKREDTAWPPFFPFNHNQ